MGGRNRRCVIVSHWRTSKFSRSQFWNRQEMSLVSVVLLSFSFYNIQPWLHSELLDNAFFLVLFVSLKSDNLLWMEKHGQVWHADRNMTFAVGI